MKEKFSAFLIALLIASVFIYIPAGRAHTITVDGDPGDWVADASGQTVNTGQYYACGEFVWVDAEDDDTGDGDYTYPTNASIWADGTADLVEFRITIDWENIYFLIKLVNVSNAFAAPEGFSVPIITIHIDQDQVDGSGQSWAAQYMDAQFNSTCLWERAIVVKGFGSYLFDNNWVNLGTITAEGNPTENVIEVAVPYSKVGSPIGQTWRFMVTVGLEEMSNYREVQEVANATAPGGGVPAGDNDWVECDAFDAAFYTSATAQAQDWNDYNQTAGTPTILCNSAPGEGYFDVDFTQLTPAFPVVKFSFAPSMPYANETVVFDASESEPSSPTGYIMTYRWDFGDGTPIVDETSPVTTHAYQVPGVYQVSLTVIDDLGLNATKTKSIIVIQKGVGDAEQDFMLRPYQDILNTTITSNGTHILTGITFAGPIEDEDWNYTNIYLAIDTDQIAGSGQEWFPDFIDAKYPYNYTYLWELCLKIYTSTNFSLVNAAFEELPGAPWNITIDMSPDNKTVNILVPLTSIGNPTTISLGIVTSQDYGKLKDTIGFGTTGYAGWGQWVEITAAITDFSTSAGSSASAYDTKTNVGIGKSFWDIVDASYGVNATHLIVAVTFKDTTGLDNPWTWTEQWRLSIAIDIDHVENSGQEWIAFYYGDTRIDPASAEAYWEYNVLIDSPTDIHFFNSTWYDFGQNNVTASYIAEQNLMLITVPRDVLPGIDDPVLTVISGMDGGDTVYDCVGTWNFNYTEPPSPAGAYRVNPYVHDVAVRAVTSSKTIVCQTYSLKVNITVKNRGDYNETVQVKVYFNDTAVETQSVELQPQEAKLITIECYANVDKGLYFTSGYALPVPYESATANNKLKNGSIIVSMVGDVTGPDGWPDGKVNMRDIGAIARCFGSQEGDPEYNANYDIVYDGKINMRDIGLAARHFGETDP